jgi:hypothetical protein
VVLEEDRFGLTLANSRIEITLNGDKRQRFDIRCSSCNGSCVRQGAALSLKHILYALARGRPKFSKATQNTPATVEEICVYIRYGKCLERTEDGRFDMALTLPEDAFLDTMARSLAGLVGIGTKY